jgi:hypothetical protein
MLSGHTARLGARAVRKLARPLAERHIAAIRFFVASVLDLDLLANPESGDGLQEIVR